MTNAGGAHGAGTVFRIGDSGDFQSLHSFDRYVDGANPVAELLEVDTNLYGSTKFGGAGDLGTLFRMDLAGTVTTIHVFVGIHDGRNPCAPLIRTTSGNLLGTSSRGGTNDAGTVFRLDASDMLTTVHTFDPYTEGSIPRGPLIQGPTGDFFGTASGGSAAYENGTVFRLADSGSLEVLHTFTGPDGVHPIVSLIQDPEGNLLGLTSSFFSLPYFKDVPGTVFRIDTTGGFLSLHRFGWEDGIGLSTPLLQGSDGFIYGTTAQGGPSNLGTIFRIDTSGEVASLHSFEGGLDGAGPANLMQASEGNIYGTDNGGANDLGRVFILDTSGSTTTLHSFDGNDGDGPTGLAEWSAGIFYGTARSGTLFKIDASGNFDVLWGFDPPEYFGSDPNGPLMLHADKLFGTATLGASYGLGNVFNVSEDGTIIPQHSFEGTDGGYPMAALIDVDGDFWGTTEQGGEFGAGTVFMTRESLDILTKHVFTGDDGAYPVAPLLWTSFDGKFYGSTEYGGSAGFGTIFSMDYDGNITTLYAFPGQMDGAYPTTALIKASDGLLYGTAGVIYRLSDATVATNQIMPTSGPAVGNAALVAIGGGFVDNVTVAVGGVGGTELKVLDSTFLYLFTPQLSPGTLNDVTVTVPSGLATSTATKLNAFFADFLDVPQIDPFHDYIEKIVRNGVTAGCGAGNYCPQDAVTRAQMAVFLLKSKHGSAYVPPPCAGVFADVLCPSMFADWIEQLAAEGITAGCGGGNYCPTNPVTRAQMAAFLLKAEHGSTYVPPACVGVFADVTCPSLFADWIEELAAEQITGGCGGGNYCPENPNTRAQMSAFLVKTFQM